MAKRRRGGVTQPKGCTHHAILTPSRSFWPLRASTCDMADVSETWFSHCVGPGASDLCARGRWGLSPHRAERWGGWWRGTAGCGRRWGGGDRAGARPGRRQRCAGQRGRCAGQGRLLRGAGRAVCRGLARPYWPDGVPATMGGGVGGGASNTPPDTFMSNHRHDDLLRILPKRILPSQPSTSGQPSPWAQNRPALLSIAQHRPR